MLGTFWPAAVLPAWTVIESSALPWLQLVFLKFQVQETNGAFTVRSTQLVVWPVCVQAFEAVPDWELQPTPPHCSPVFSALQRNQFGLSSGFRRRIDRLLTKMQSPGGGLTYSQRTYNHSPSSSLEVTCEVMFELLLVDSCQPTSEPVPWIAAPKTACALKMLKKAKRVPVIYEDEYQQSGLIAIGRPFACSLPASLISVRKFVEQSVYQNTFCVGRSGLVCRAR